MDPTAAVAAATNPFAALTFIAAPALLTNTSSLLRLGTSNRLAIGSSGRRISMCSTSMPIGPCSQIAATARPPACEMLMCSGCGRASR